MAMNIGIANHLARSIAPYIRLYSGTIFSEPWEYNRFDEGFIFRKDSTEEEINLSFDMLKEAIERETIKIPVRGIELLFFAEMPTVCRPARPPVRRSSSMSAGHQCVA